MTNPSFAYNAVKYMFSPQWAGLVIRPSVFHTLQKNNMVGIITVACYFAMTLQWELLKGQRGYALSVANGSK